MSWQDTEIQRLETLLTDIAIHVILTAENNYRENALHQHQWRIQWKAELEEEECKHLHRHGHQAGLTALPYPPRFHGTCAAVRPGGDGTLQIEDTRRGTPRTLRLDPWESAVYAAIADIGTQRSVLAELSAYERCSPTEVRETLSRFVDEGLALEENSRFLALALPPIATPKPAIRAKEMRRVTNQGALASPK